MRARCGASPCSRRRKPPRPPTCSRRRSPRARCNIPTMPLRRSLAVILCLLLLSLQSQALVHPLSHLGQAKPQDTGIASSTVDAPCLQCALLAGGATAVVADATTFHAGNVADVVVIHF